MSLKKPPAPLLLLLFLLAPLQSLPTGIKGARLTHWHTYIGNVGAYEVSAWVCVCVCQDNCLDLWVAGAVYCVIWIFRDKGSLTGECDRQRARKDTNI